MFLLSILLPLDVRSVNGYDLDPPMLWLKEPSSQDKFYIRK